MSSNRIRVVLADRGLSAKALTDQMGGIVNTAIMSYIMNDKALPTRDWLKRMCEVLNCRPEDLYDATDTDLLSDFKSVQREVVPDDREECGVRFSAEDVESMRRAVINLSEVILHEREAK